MPNTTTKVSTRTSVAIGLGGAALVAMAIVGITWQRRTFTRSELPTNITATTGSQDGQLVSGGTTAACGAVQLRLTSDAPGGTGSITANATVGSWLVSAPPSCDVTVVVAAKIDSSIRLTRSRTFSLYKNSVTATNRIGTLAVAIPAFRGELVAAPVVIRAGSSEKIFVTADTVDARTDDALTATLRIGSALSGTVTVTASGSPSVGNKIAY